MRRNSRVKSKLKQHASAPSEKARIVTDGAEVNRNVLEFDRAAPERMLPSIELMAKEERKIYERSN
jgi:hypothetical protein